jgi:hypothetical protein
VSPNNKQGKGSKIMAAIAFVMIFIALGQLLVTRTTDNMIAVVFLFISSVAATIFGGIFYVLSAPKWIVSIVTSVASDVLSAVGSSATGSNRRHNGRNKNRRRKGGRGRNGRGNGSNNRHNEIQFRKQ